MFTARRALVGIAILGLVIALGFIPQRRDDAPVFVTLVATPSIEELRLEFDNALSEAGATSLR